MIHSTQVCIPLKPLFSRHKGAGVQFTDEPTGNLDSVTAGEIINILKTLAKDRNKCIIVVTHSKEVADSADIILELSGKKLKKVNKMNLEVE